VTLSGVVAEIAGFGTEEQGLVRYTVRVEVAQPDPRVLLGMTANVNIVTEVTEGALSVPLNAIQLDANGEYVNRVKSDGTLEQVRVVSGTSLDDDTVIVTGSLTPGDEVQVIDPQPSTNQSPFGG
jgi:HlyD family secretion protein